MLIYRDFLFKYIICVNRLAYKFGQDEFSLIERGLGLPLPQFISPGFDKLQILMALFLLTVGSF